MEWNLESSFTLLKKFLDVLHIVHCNTILCAFCIIIATSSATFGFYFALHLTKPGLSRFFVPVSVFSDSSI